VVSSIVSLQRNTNLLEQDLSDSAAHLDAVNTQVASRQQRLGGETKTIEALNQLLAKQERDRQRFATVETMFTSNQASVLRRGDNVIIRMIGLNLYSGTAYLKPEHADILTTLENGIGVFPESRVVVVVIPMHSVPTSRICNSPNNAPRRSSIIC
jgi:hypothetical protein